MTRDELTHLIHAFAPGSALLEHRQLTGGVSAQTTALKIQGPDGQVDRYVVRVHGERDVARDPDIAAHEFQLLQALYASGLPVPQPVYVCRADDVFETPVVIVKFIEGEIATDPPSPTRFAADLAYWLARIHEFDLASADLTFLVANDYQSVQRFEIQQDDSPLVQSICRTLASAGTVAYRNSEVLLHGDFWRGNLLWKDGELTAILDWEDAAIGDPIIDLARSRLELHWTHGEMAREQFTRHYLSYRDIDIGDLAFWDLAMALGFARAFQGWGLSNEREQELQEALEGFVEHASRQLGDERD